MGLTFPNPDESESTRRLMSNYWLVHERGAMPKTVKVPGGHQYSTKTGKPAGPVRKTAAAATKDKK